MFRHLLVVIFLLQPWLISGLIRLEFLVVLSCLLLLLFHQTRVLIPVKVLLFTLIYFILILLIIFLHTTFDDSYIRVNLKLLALFWGAFILVYTYKLKVVHLILPLRLVVAVSLIFYLLCVLFEPFRNLSLLFKGNTYDLENSLQFYRLWFPSSAHTFHLGLLFVSIFSFQMIVKEKFIWLLSTLICATISARSAMLICILLFMTSMIFNNRKLILYFILSLPLLLFIGNQVVQQSTAARYALEPLLNIVDKGEVRSKSSDDLVNKHLYLPSENQILFGTGKYIGEDGKYFGHTDSGVVRPLLYGGFIFQALYISILFAILVFFARQGIFGYAIVFCFLAMNVKAEVLFPSPHFAFFSILFWLVYYENCNKSYISKK